MNDYQIFFVMTDIRQVVSNDSLVATRHGISTGGLGTASKVQLVIENLIN